MHWPVEEGDSIRTYKTAQIAGIVGVHPNTIRFYEQMELLPAVPRTKSGYRVFSDQHLQQLRLLRTAFRAEIISSCLRNEVFQIVKAAAAGDFKRAYHDTKKYLEHLKSEKCNAEEAIRLTLEIVGNRDIENEHAMLTGRNETAEILGITPNVLRDWERNGLIRVPSNSRGWRKYGPRELTRLKIIRTLRNAHYSMMSILRMLKKLDEGRMDVRETINTPDQDEDIVCAADRYISALSTAETDALEMIRMLESMRLHAGKLDNGGLQME